ncbi:MAG: flagellar basal body rod protein FlgC [Phycisphaeraceae bacterium]|nr:flagellar basal body rod protein FlgC [Phycisphaeraceae bacterium]
MYGALDISTSGMIAQRTRLESITVNIINVDTHLDAAGKNNPFKRRTVHFAPGDPTAGSPQARRLGVHVAAIEEDPSFVLKYEPTNPYADESGYVKYPDVNIPFEQINAYEAQRAYEANIVVAEATKAMMTQALRLIA